MYARIKNSTGVRIFAGVVVIGGAVFLVQWLSGFFPQNSGVSGEWFNLVIAVIQCILAVVCYKLLYRFLEKRQIAELNRISFFEYAVPGFLTGLVLQSMIILVLYLAGGYVVTRINPVSFMLPAFTTALTAGFVAEIIIRGVLFRLVEEKLGTILTIAVMMILFMALHMGGDGSTLLSVLAVSMQAGLLLSTAYVFTRSLWFPIFLHFSWDFAEPGIFGAINPGNTIEKSLLTCQVTGQDIVTGGSMGPVNSIQSILFCLVTGILFLWLARRNNRLVSPSWKKIN